MKARFEPVALSTAFLYSDQAKKKAYYVFPIKQQTLHIQYWKDMLAQAGFRKATFPTPGRNIGPSGATGAAPASARRPASASTAPAFRWAWSRRLLPVVPELVDALYVKLVDDSGKLLVDDPR